MVRSIFYMCLLANENSGQCREPEKYVFKICNKHNAIWELFRKGCRKSNLSDDARHVGSRRKCTVGTSKSCHFIKKQVQRNAGNRS